MIILGIIIFLTLCIGAILIWNRMYTRVDRVIMSNPLSTSGIEYINLEETKYYRYIKVQFQQNQYKYISIDKKRVRLFETIDLEEDNIFNCKLLITKKILYNSVIKAESGNILVYRSGKNYYLGELVGSTKLCTDWTWMRDKYEIDKHDMISLKDVKSGKVLIVEYKNLVSIVESTIETYYLQNKKEGN